MFLFYMCTNRIDCSLYSTFFNSQKLHRNPHRDTRTYSIRSHILYLLVMWKLCTCVKSVVSSLIDSNYLSCIGSLASINAKLEKSDVIEKLTRFGCKIGIAYGDFGSALGKYLQAGTGVLLYSVALCRNFCTGFPKVNNITVPRIWVI